MLLAAILLVLGVAVGLVRGGRLDNISGVEFRLPWLVFGGLALQVAAQAASRAIPVLHRQGGPIVLGISYGLVIIFVLLNFRYPGTALVGVGLALNLAVILANGAMPVSLSAIHAAGGHALPGLQSGVKHHVMNRGTRLRWLGDILPLPGLGVASAGDVVLGAGMFVLVQHLIAYPPKRRGR